MPSTAAARQRLGRVARTVAAGRHRLAHRRRQGAVVVGRGEFDEEQRMAAAPRVQVGAALVADDLGGVVDVERPEPHGVDGGKRQALL